MMDESSSVATGGEPALLRPISQAEPAGRWIRYDPIFDDLKAARRADDPALPQGVWKHAKRRADWQRVVVLCQEVLTEHSKDMQIAGWLCEGMLHMRGALGLAQGIATYVAMCEGFWESVYPHCPDGDMEARLNCLAWLRDRLTCWVGGLPLTESAQGGRGFSVAEDRAHRMHSGSEGSGPGGVAAQQRDDALRRSVEEMPAVWWDDSVAAVDVLLQAVRDLDASSSQLLGDAGLSWQKPLRAVQEYRDRLQACAEACRARAQEAAAAQEAARQAAELEATQEAVRQAAELEAEEAGESVEQATVALVAEAIAPIDVPAQQEDQPPLSSTHTPRSREEAYQMLRAAADYLSSLDPHSPVPLLVRRALQWSDMSLAELLPEIVTDSSERARIEKLLALENSE